MVSFHLQMAKYSICVHVTHKAFFFFTSYYSSFTSFPKVSFLRLVSLVVDGTKKRIWYSNWNLLAVFHLLSYRYIRYTRQGMQTAEHWHYIFLQVGGKPLVLSYVLSVSDHHFDFLFCTIRPTKPKLLSGFAHWACATWRTTLQHNIWSITCYFGPIL